MPRCLEQGTSLSLRETEGLHLSPGPVLDPNDAQYAAKDERFQRIGEHGAVLKKYKCKEGFCVSV